MVGIEELLERVQKADTEMGRQWILLELQMSQMPEALVSMLWAAAIPHFFDAHILAALRPELAHEAEQLFDDLQSLTFVEEFPGQGYNIHELTREVLLSKLWQQEREEFLMLSKRAADYFFDAKVSSEEDVEFAYHEILGEGKPSDRLLERVINWRRYSQIDRIQSVIQTFLEHENAERLDAFGYAFSDYLTGLVKTYLANYKEAERLFNQAKEEVEKQRNNNPRYAAMLLRDLSSSKRDQGDVRNAIVICEKSLKICKEQLGPEHIDTATGLNNLAALYKSQGRYSEAEPLFIEALKIRKTELGDRHPDTASSLNNLALLYKLQERYSEAEPLYIEALKICKTQLGDRHPSTATSLNNLAGLYESQGRYSKAEPLYVEALKICKAKLGDRHPNTTTSLNNLRGLYESQGRYSEAAPLYIKASL